jgi:5-methyltetrahydrofolate corrinoid/iron sulfur protein methyltransferase
MSMILIGEAINGLQPGIRQAILSRDKEVIRQLARKQVDAGAAFLDVSTGTAWPKPAEIMVWLVTTIQEGVEVPISLNSRRLDVIEAGLRVSRNPVMINAATGEKEKIPFFMELALKHKADLVCLTMDEQGIPPHAVGRISIAKRILDFAEQYSFPRERIYIDPVLLPLKFFQAQGSIVLEAIRGIALEKEPPHIIAGISNCSQGMKQRTLINRTFLSMAVACGLDTVICDVLDADLMETIAAAEVILERRPHSDPYAQETKKASAAGDR